MDFATLGVSIKRDGTVETVRDLEKLVPAAVQAEKAVDGLNRASKDTAAAAYAKTIDRAATSLRGFDAIAAKAAQQAAYVADQMSTITMRDLRGDDIAAYGRELDQLRAKFSPIFAASKQYEASLDEINYAHRVGAITAQEQQAAIMRLDAQYEMAAQAANKLTAANKSMAGSFHTTNLMFQAQDIAMMSMMGQAPMAVALQQGMQVGGIFHQIGNGRQVVQALGGALMGLLNPINLATIAVIGLGAAGVQALMSWVQSAAPVKRTMEEHREWLGNLLDGYDELSKAVNDYMDKASQLPVGLRRLEIARGLDTDIERLREVQSMLDNFRIRDDAAFQLPWQTLNQDLDVLREIKSQLDSNTISSEKFAEQMDLIAFNPNVDPEVRQLAQGLYNAAREAAGLEVNIEGGRRALAGLTDEAIRSAGAMATLNGTFALLRGGAGLDTKLQGILDGTTALDSLKGMVPEIRSTQEIAASQLQKVMDSFGSPETKAAAQATYDLILENEAILTARREANRSGGRGGRERDPYSDLTRGAYEFIAAQQIEQQALGMTAEAAQRLRFEQDLLNKASNDNIKLTPRMRSELGELAAQMAATEAQTKMLTQAANDNAALWGAAQDGVSGIIKTWARGGDILDTISDKLLNIGDMLIDMAVRNLFMGAFGGGQGFGNVGRGGLLGGLLIPGILHSGGVAGADGYAHDRAFAPSLWDNATRYHTGGIAGLKANEVPAILERGEVVLPRGAGVAPQQVRVHVTLGWSQDSDGNIAPFVVSVAQDTIGAAAPAIVGASVNQANKSAPAALARHQSQRAGGDYRTM